MQVNGDSSNGPEAMCSSNSHRSPRNPLAHTRTHSAIGYHTTRIRVALASSATKTFSDLHTRVVVCVASLLSVRLNVCRVCCVLRRKTRMLIRIPRTHTAPASCWLWQWVGANENILGHNSIPTSSASTAIRMLCTHTHIRVYYTHIIRKAPFAFAHTGPSGVRDTETSFECCWCGWKTQTLSYLQCVCVCGAHDAHPGLMRYVAGAAFVM